MPRSDPVAKPITRLNWSTLRHLATSPKLLKWRVDHPEAESDVMRLGRAIHCLILEPKEFPARWIIAGSCAAPTKAGTPCGNQGSQFLFGNWYCRIKGHAPAGAGPLPEGVEVITEDQLAVTTACAAAVREHKVAAKILTNGLAEHALEWTDPETGIACRGRLDYLKPTEIVDVKSTHEETVRGIERHAAQRLYYAQLAWYHDGAIAAKRLQPDAPLPVMVAVQNVEPYDVAVFRLTRVAYEAGQILYRDLLLKYRDCQAAEYWPGIAPGILDLNLPMWAPGMNGSDYAQGEPF